eukprot:172120-Hanusia_phi.AAC.1
MFGSTPTVRFRRPRHRDRTAAARHAGQDSEIKFGDSLGEVLFHRPGPDSNSEQCQPCQGSGPPSGGPAPGTRYRNSTTAPGGRVGPATRYRHGVLESKRPSASGSGLGW